MQYCWPNYVSFWYGSAVLPQSSSVIFNWVYSSYKLYTRIGLSTRLYFDFSVTFLGTLRGFSVLLLEEPEGHFQNYEKVWAILWFLNVLLHSSLKFCMWDRGYISSSDRVCTDGWVVERIANGCLLQSLFRFDYDLWILLDISNDSCRQKSFDQSCASQITLYSYDQYISLRFTTC